MDVTHLSQQLRQLTELKEEGPLHVEPLIQAVRQLQLAYDPSPRHGKEEE